MIPTKFYSSRDGHVVFCRAFNGGWIVGYSVKSLGMPTFIRWLALQTGRNDRIGDLARDTLTDSCWPNQASNPSMRDLARHMHIIHGVDWVDPDGAMSALFAAYQEWHDAGGRYRDPDKPAGKISARAVYTRSRKNSAASAANIGPKVRFSILKRDGYRCQICGRTAQHEGVTLEIDHRVPRARGGSDDLSNLWVLCFECNRGKSDDSL